MVGMHFGMVDKYHLDLLHGAGKQLHAWTINHVDLMRRMLVGVEHACLHLPAGPLMPVPLWVTVGGHAPLRSCYRWRYYIMPLWPSALGRVLCIPAEDGFRTLLGTDWWWVWNKHLPATAPFFLADPLCALAHPARSKHGLSMFTLRGPFPTGQWVGRHG